MKKIIFFAYDMNIGGMEKALLILINRLAEDYDISLVLENMQGPLLKKLDKRIHVSEYRSSTNRVVIFRKLFNFLHRRFWLLTHHNKYGFSCSYATYSVIGSRLALGASENSALYIHSNYYDYYSGDTDSIIDFFSMLGSNKFKHLLFVSNESKRSLAAVLPEADKKGIVINNLIDYGGVLDLSAERIEIDKEDGEMLFLFVGRLEESSKRLSRLLEAFSIACEEKEDYRLWIIGNGRDYNLCEELIEEFSLHDNVKLLGSKENPYPYMKLADCIILTSDFEGYPVIYNECLVLGKHIMTTIPVSDKYVDIRDWAVILPKDCLKIAEAIKTYEWVTKEYKKLDFHEINECRIRELEEIINGK